MQREGSFSAGARVLRIDQTTVGRRVAALESAVGARLFRRGRDGISLTTAGAEAYLTKTAALARIGAARVAALGTLEPVLATLLALAVLHERVTVALAAGLFVEMAGLALVAFPEHAWERERRSEGALAARGWSRYAWRTKGGAHSGRVTDGREAHLITMMPRTGARARRRTRVTIGGAAAFTQSLGAGGFSAEVMRVPARGSPVQGTIYLGEKDFDYVGDVAWVKPGDPRIHLRGRVGVRFTQLDAEARRLIEVALSTQAR